MTLASEGDSLAVCGLLEDESTSGPDFYLFAAYGTSATDVYQVTVDYCLENKLQDATIQLWSKLEGAPIAGVAAARGQGSFTATLRGGSSYYLSLSPAAPHAATKYSVSVQVESKLGAVLAEDFEWWPPYNLTVNDDDPCLGWFPADVSQHPTGVLPATGYYMARFNAHDCPVGSESLQTGTLDLSSSTSVWLAFDMYHDTDYPTSHDRIQVQYDLGKGWLDIGPAIERPAAVVGWKTESVDLGSLAGHASVRLALVATTAYGNDVHVDNVALLAS